MMEPTAYWFDLFFARIKPITFAKKINEKPNFTEFMENLNSKTSIIIIGEFVGSNFVVSCIVFD